MQPFVRKWSEYKMTTTEHVFVTFGLTCFIHLFQVETIGDAYMVVGGVPERTPDHMNRICDMALGMIHESNLVISPATKKPLQVASSPSMMYLLQYLNLREWKIELEVEFHIKIIIPL